MLPAVMQRALDAALDRLKKSLGENLYSCLLYGSAVRGNVVPGVSDLNLLLILEQSTPEAHAVIAECIRGDVEIEPFILGRPGMERSFQAFALKFRSIQRHYQVLHGADPFTQFIVSDDVLRFLCEQALRNLRLRLVHAFVTHGNDPGRFQRHLIAIVPGVMTDISEALRCSGANVPNDFKERIPLFESALSVNAGVLTRLLTLKNETRKLSATELMELHSQLYVLLSHTIAWMETRWPRLEPRASG